MSNSVRAITLAFTASIVLAAASRAQFIPDKFTNLKVLPTDISKQELTQTMRGFAFSLGVRCDHCHVEEKAPEHGFDFAADDKTEKKTARAILEVPAFTIESNAEGANRHPSRKIVIMEHGSRVLGRCPRVFGGLCVGGAG